MGIVVTARQARLAATLMFGALAFSACDGCSDPGEVGENNSTTMECAPGEILNPINGECEPERRQNPTPNPNSTNRPDDMRADLDAGGVDASDMGQEDMERLPPPDMEMVMVDLGAEDRCQDGVDSDGDGLTNQCECQLGTDPGSSDTDGDGLSDGFEDENKNCRLDLGETQPTVADTDSDGVSDGDELTNGLDPLVLDTDDDGLLDGVEFNSSCLDGTKEDTDGDGIQDGLEDLNKDGEIGICPDRMYNATCAQGEYDPCKADTDGDGEEDGAEVNFLGCRPEFLQQIPAPNLVTSAASDYQLALAEQAVGATVMGQAAHAFDHAQEGYAGFVVSLPGNGSSVEDLRDAVLSRVQSNFPSASLTSSGRRTLTHDGFDAIASIQIDLGRAERANTARDSALSALLNVGSVSHGLSNAFSLPAGSSAMVFGIVNRGGRYLVTAGFTAEATYQDRSVDAGFLIDDVTSSASLARSSETLENACVSYRVNDKPQVDFLWVVDGSGSMSEENNLVKNYANDFVQILTASNLDWRLGVVSSSCINISNDAAVSADVKALFGGGGGFTSPCPNIPFGGGGFQNGELCDRNGANFTTDPAKFKACIDAVATQGLVTEYTITVATAAIDRALPRQANNPKKLRPDAATVIISVTDEFDDFVQSKMGWADAGGQGDPPNDLSSGIDYAQLDVVLQPFIDYFRRAEVAATAFGIYWIPGQQCNTAAEAAAGIDRVVGQTGGTAGNICSGNLQMTLATIAQASAGLASGLRVEGVPVASTLDVRQGDVSTQQLVEPERDRSQGWDYDAVTNAVSFYGSNPPETNDRVVITYKRWVNSVQGCVTDEDCANGFQKYQCRDGKCI